MLKHEDCKVKVLHVTDGKDPDEYVKKNGREAFMKLVSEALPYTDYKLQAAKRGLNVESEEGKLDYMKRTAPILKELGPVEADIYTKKIARDIGISENAIKLEILGNNNDSGEKHRFQPRQDREEKTSSLSAMEITVLKCVFTEPKLTEELLSEEELFQSSLGRKIIDIIFELYGLNGDFSLGQVSDRLEPDESKYISKALDNIAVAGNAEEIMRQCVDKQKISRLKSREERVLAMLSMADEENNTESARKLTVELMEIQKEIKVHGGKFYVNGKN